VTVPVDWRTVVTAWSAPPLPVTVLVGAALTYAWGVARLRHRGRSWPLARSLAFGGGLAVVAIALCSGLAHYDTSVFALHVVQHMLLAMVAPPLLALGAPITLALQGGSRPVQERLLRALHSAPVTVLTHPVVTWVLFGGSLIALYATGLYPITLRHPWLHDLVHVHFLVTGMLFFWPVVGLDPGRWRLPFGARLLYLLVAVPFHAVVGVALISTPAPLWSAHTLADQQTGGGVMMLGGDLLTVVILAVVFAQWASAEERAAVRLDAMGPDASTLEGNVTAVGDVTAVAASSSAMPTR